MLSIKRKLSSKSGASMLLAMVFLMFCLFIGGSVLAAATANGSRVEHLKNDQQNYLSQRSAMLLMADMLTSNGKPLAITIKEVTKPVTAEDGTTTDATTATFTCANLNSTPNALQQMVFECVIKNSTPEGAKANFSALKIGSSLTGNDAKNGTITITEPAPEGSTGRQLKAKYSFSNDYDLKIVFDFTASGAPEPTESAYLILTMDGSVNRGTPSSVTVNGVTTTTTTTSITWKAPEIQKGGSADE